MIAITPFSDAPHTIPAAGPQPTVLIVGAGPAGLYAACELLRHGIRPRVIERRSEPHHEARGTALQPAVLEMLERGGLIEPFLDAGVDAGHEAAGIWRMSD